jgi:hypothetical protein
MIDIGIEYLRGGDNPLRPGPIQRRQYDGRQETDDGNDHQKLD